jgi:hypothetical protein
MKSHRKNLLCSSFGFVAILSLILMSACGNIGTEQKIPSKLKLTPDELMNKIKGGWAGQTIGVTYGGPTEFRYQSKMIPDDVQVPWGDADYVLNTMTKSPGLYDDIYMDLTFVEVFERLGVDAPVDSLAMAFAHAGYPLWHANQAARYNILNGIMPPQSGHWRYNPHADDIDYQIEADYAGLMAPAMPNTASEISDKVGHIMNYGDGWYGGVYMGAMYSIAFASDNIEFIVTEALKTIPAESKFYRCMNDVIECWRANPDDWRVAWDMLDKKWNEDIACSEGALRPFNIDATINSAYVIIGLLYGEGDFGRTLDISMRCGQDSDCNPASAGGILGTAIGYDNIPEEWLAPLRKAEDVKFAYTNSSLNDTYRMSYSHALQLIEREGGKVSADKIVIKCQQPVAVRLEQSFPNLKPRERVNIRKSLAEPSTFEADCAGLLICGEVKSADKSYIAEVEITIDGKTKEIVKMPANWTIRRFEVYHNFELAAGHHTVQMRWLNPIKEATLNVYDVLLLDKE